jgi:hypothetical protein
LIPSPSQRYETFLDDIELHCTISRDIIRSIFDRLLLDDEMQYVFGLHPSGLTRSDLVEQVDDLIKLRDDALASLLAAFYRDGKPLSSLSKAKQLTLKHIIETLS